MEPAQLQLLIENVVSNAVRKDKLERKLKQQLDKLNQKISELRVDAPNVTTFEYITISPREFNMKMCRGGKQRTLALKVTVKQ